VTQEVLLLSRWQAADLYWRDIDALRGELSMEDCSPALRAMVGEQCREPYRELLRTVRDRLAATRDWLNARLRGELWDDGVKLINTAHSFCNLYCYVMSH
jgi:phosphoenolpyruvate carboxylase